MHRVRSWAFTLKRKGVAKDKMGVRSGWDSLEYRLTDVLEMHYSKDGRVLRRITEKLLRQRIQDSNLYLLTCFALEGALVVIQNGSRKPLRELYLLNPKSRSFQRIHLR